MKAAQFKTGGYRLSLIIGAALVSTFAFPLGGYAATAPAPKISATPATVKFSPIKVGGSSLKTVTIKNTGSADLVVGAMTLTGTDSSQFGQTNDCSAPLQKNGFCTVTVRFTPTVPYVKKSATLNITSNDLRKPTALVKLSGQASPPKVSASPMSVNLSSAGIGIPSAAATVTIKNTGVSDLNISPVTITGPNAPLFTAADNCESPLPSGESCTVDVSFTPDSTGTKSASLQIASDDPKKSLLPVRLTGKSSTTTSTNYSTADLAGTWTGSTLASGVGTQRWMRITLIIAPDGSFTGTVTDSDGTKTSPGKFSISSDGNITEPNNPKMLCTMDAGKTVFACTDTPDPGVAQIGVFTKNGGSYSQADLEGTWRGNALAAGTGGNWWARMDIAFAAGGAYTGTYSDSAGNAGPLSGAFNITTDGAITDLANHPNMLCSMDAGKTVVACTDTPIPGAVLVQVFTKLGEPLTLSGLAGTWSINSIATGPASPWWKRAVGPIKPDGSYTSTKTFYDGSTKSGSGIIAIMPAGVIKFSESGNDILCQVDANNTVAACTKTWNVTDPGDPKYPFNGTTELQVITRKLK